MGHYLGFDIGIAVMSVYDGDKFPGIQVDSYGEKQSGVAPYQLHSPCGFLSIPHDPDTDNDGNPERGCTALFAIDGGKGHAWLGSDPRVVPLLPTLTKGGMVLYGGKLLAPSYTFTDGDTGSQTHYVPYDFTGDTPNKAMSIQLNVDQAGEEHIAIIHGNGSSITMKAGGKNSTVLRNSTGTAYVEVNDDGIILNGPVTVNGGLNSGGPAGAQSVVLAPQLILLLQQLIQGITALGTATAAAATAIPLGVGSPAALAATTASSNIGKIAGQLSTIAAQNTKGL